MEATKRKRNIPKPTNFGKNLKFLRRLQGITQSKLAEQTGLTRNNIASYESGLIEPNGEKFLTLCQYFDKSPEHMLENDYTEVSQEELVSALGEDAAGPVFAQDQLLSFIDQTREMTKIFEGYQTFYTMKSGSVQDQKSKELFSIMEDLLSILQELVQSNWSLIQSMGLQLGQDESE